MIAWCTVRPALAGVLLMVGLTSAAPAQAPRFAALSHVQPGQWDLQEASGARHSLCVRDPASLFQLRHRDAQCSRFVIDNGPGSATVHYTCPGAGYGRTTITVETPRLLKIVSSGIEGGAPFDIDAEARRTGICRPSR